MTYRIPILSWFFAALILIISSCNQFSEVNNTESFLSKPSEKRFTLGGAPIEVVIGLSHEALSITDTLSLVVKLEYEESVQIVAPYLSESVYFPLLLVKPPTEETKWSSDIKRMISTWRYQLEPVKSGEFSIKPIKIHFRLEDEKSDIQSEWPIHTIETEPIEYTVSSVEIDEGEDIRDIKRLILPAYNIIPVLGTVFSLATVLALTLIVRRYRNSWNKDPIPIEARINYYLQALEKLSELEAQDLIRKKEFHTLHTRLSLILRGYIENFYGIRAQEQTTEEFIKGISRSSIFTTEQQGMLHQFLSLADLVKFATYDPGANSSSLAMEGVRRFIETTGKPDEV